jgi:hypothetical protein
VQPAALAQPTEVDDEEAGVLEQRAATADLASASSPDRNITR